MEDKFELLYDKIRMRIGRIEVGMDELGNTDHLRGKLMELEELKAFADRLIDSEQQVKAADSVGDVESFEGCSICGEQNPPINGCSICKQENA